MNPGQPAVKYPDIMDDYFPKGNDFFYGLHHYTFVQQLNDVNFAEAWKKNKAKVSALYGEHDLHVIDDEWAKRTAQIVNAYHPGNGEWQIVPDTEHGMSKVTSMEENVRLRNEDQLNAQYYAEHFNHDLANIINNWIRKVLKKA